MVDRGWFPESSLVVLPNEGGDPLLPLKRHSVQAENKNNVLFSLTFWTWGRITKKNSNVAKKGPDQQRILNSHTIKSQSTPHLRHVTDFTLGMFRQFSIY